MLMSVGVIFLASTINNGQLKRCEILGQSVKSRYVGKSVPHRLKGVIKMVQEIVIPTYLQNQLVQAVQSQSIFQYKVLIVFAYLLNFSEVILGRFLVTTFRVFFKSFISPILLIIQRNLKVDELFSQKNEYYKYRQQRRQPVKKNKIIEKKEESFDDFLQPEIEPEIEELPPKKAESSSENIQTNENVDLINSKPPTINIDEEHAPPQPPPQPASFKTFKEDLKSLKGSKSDIEKLKSYGYNRYRFVSKHFLKRNHLLAENEEERDVSEDTNEEAAGEAEEEEEL